MNIEEAARAWYEDEASVLPAIRGKRPDRSWTAYQEERANWDDIETSIANADGFGIVTGYGGLEMLEIEGSAIELLEPLGNALAAAGFLSRLSTYVEVTPSGGFHWIYRVEGEQEGSQKLARSETGKTMIETRGRFAWTVVAPSGGSIHDEIPGGQWRAMGASTPGVVATFTEQEIAQVYDICRSFDRMPPPAPEVHREALQRAPDGSVSPGQDYEARTRWHEILEPHGWTPTPGRGPGYWTRPGKRFGVSADITPDGNLYVFSTSCAPLEDGRSYTKFGAYAALEHGGDWQRAARELRARGYGTPVRAPTVGPEVILTPEQRERLQSRNVPGPPTPTPAEEHAQPAEEAVGEVAVSTLLQSEDGHAELLIREHGPNIRYCVELGKWLAWDGVVWRVQQPEGMVREYAKRVARVLPHDSTTEVKFKQRCLSAIGTSGCLRQAATDLRVAVSISTLDSFPRELNTPGGVLDLATGVLRPADPSHMHTKITKVAPDFEADRSRWLDFLAETFDGDQEMIDYIQRLLGYSAVGEVGPHILPFCWGSGGNGKGVLLETVMELLGDYADSTPANFLMAGLSRHETEIAALAGKRLVVSSEINEDDRFDEAKVKMLTGGDMLKGRFMRRDHFTFRPSHTLWLVGNAEPTVRNGGRGFWRRLRKIPFLHEVAIPIDRLKDIFVSEHGPAIMAWIAEGAAAYYREGLVEPRIVVDATEEYRNESDTVGRFVAERCKVGGGANVVVATAKFREAYEDWVKHELGGEPVSAKALTQTLTRLGIGQNRNKSSRFYTNITILNPEDSPSYPHQSRIFGDDG